MEGNRAGAIKQLGELISGRPADDRNRVGCVAFAPDESRLAWSPGKGKVVLMPWNRYRNCLLVQENLNEEEAQLFQDQITIECNFPVVCMAFGTPTPESELVPGSSSKCYWQRMDSIKHLVFLTGHSNGRIRVWDPYNGRLVLELTDHTKAASSIAFAPDGSLRVVSSSYDGTLKLWDMADDGNMFKTLQGHKAPIYEIAWSPDSKLLCSVGQGRKALLWDMASYSLFLTLSGHYNDVLSCAFSPDGATVATASSDTRVIVWDTTSGDPLRTLHHLYPTPGIIYMSGSNDSQVISVTFSPNGCHIATICEDGFVRYWDLSEYQESVEPVAQCPLEDAMTSCSFTPLGGTLAVGHSSGSARFYSTPTTVPSLLHLSRMSIRKSLGDVSSNTKVLLPSTLKPYLQYKQW